MTVESPLAGRLVAYPLVWAPYFKGWLVEVDVVTEFFQWWLRVSGSKLSCFLNLLPYCHINILNQEWMPIRRQFRKSILILNLNTMIKCWSELALMLFTNIDEKPVRNPSLINCSFLSLLDSTYTFTARGT